MRTLTRLLLYPLLLAAGLAGCGDPAVTDGEPGPPELVAASEAGDVKRVRALLRQDAPVDGRDACRWTPLMKAALNGHADVARALLDAGAEVDSVDKGGYSALMLAASNDRLETVGLLLERGADPDRVESTSGWTALLWAAKRGHARTVERLLERGASTAHRGHDGRSAADWAEAEGFHDIGARLAQGTPTENE